MRRAVTRLVVAATAAATAVALAGCSEISALAPVGGNALAEVRFGAIDALQARQIDILTAPVCAAEPDTTTVTCEGTTTAGADIFVRSSTADDATIVVHVGGETIYDGALRDLLDEAARG